MPREVIQKIKKERINEFDGWMKAFDYWEEVGKYSGRHGSIEGEKGAFLGWVWSEVPEIITRIEIFDREFSRPGTELIKPEAKTWDKGNVRAFLVKKE